MDLTSGQKQLLAYWGIIQAAVSQRASTAALWEAVRSDALAQGVTIQGVSAIDMGRLRSIVADQRNAMEAFGLLRPNEAITQSQIGTDISARDLAAQALAPTWLVRFEHDVVVEGELQTLWRTSTFEGSLPATAGSLRSAVEADAQALADDYDVTHAGVGRIQIVAV